MTDFALSAILYLDVKACTDLGTVQETQSLRGEKKMRRIVISFVCLSLLLSLSGCSLIHTGNSKRYSAYHDTVTALFHAIDEKNSDAIYNLFSPSTRGKDEDLEEQIARLLSIYTGMTDEIGWYGNPNHCDWMMLEIFSKTPIVFLNLSNNWGIQTAKISITITNYRPKMASIDIFKSEQTIPSFMVLRLLLRLNI